MHLPTLVSGVVTSCLICASGLGLQATRTVAAQASPISDQAPEHIVRLLADEGKVIAPKGTIKHAIDKDTRSFFLPTGQSRVAVFRMPEYRAPYTLTIRSLLNFGFSKSIFVPSGLFFDAEFQQTRALPEAQFATRGQSMTKGYRLEAAIPVDDHNKEDRFLLLYTNGESVGKRLGTVTAVGASIGVITMIDLPVKRGAGGRMEFETKPNK